MELTRGGRTPEELAHEFEPSAQTIRTWVRQAARDTGHRPQVLLRFRHPEKAPIRAARGDGRTWTAVDPAKGDVDLSGLQGRVEVDY